MVARDMLVGAAAKCPEAKIFMAGYSEGGMVSHNAVAYAPEDIKKRVSVSCLLSIGPTSILNRVG
jgi:hypothetical protein